MGRNMGTLDRQLRLFFGTALVMMWIFGPLGWWGLLGFLPLVTGLTGVCPIYPLLGINTCGTPRGDISRAASGDISRAASGDISRAASGDISRAASGDTSGDTSGTPRGKDPT